MKITIIGAGMAGLVAANMLRRYDVTVLERNASLPHNHTAVLRFRSTAVSDATAIPFEEGWVRKGLWDEGKVINEPTIAHINRYSALVTGELHDRSVLNLTPQKRWMAPVNFIELMARDVPITYDYHRCLAGMKEQWWSGPVISTVPMPVLMDYVGFEHPVFQSFPVWTLKADITSPRSTICQTLYNTDPNEWYRATIHNQELTLEFMFDPSFGNVKDELSMASNAFDRFFNINDVMDSIVTNTRVNKIPIGKIMPIDDKVRKKFMLHMTERYGVYSLGRFATWKNILLDEVVQDVKKIDQMIQAGHTYEMRKA